MKDRGILFSAPMVRALLAGTKTQTRRIVKPQPELVPADKLFGRKPGSYWWPSRTYQSMLDVPGEVSVSCCPYGVAGDRLWVRETWTHDAGSLEEARAQHEDAMPESPLYFRASLSEDEASTFPRWRPAIHMPRWASRITLEVTGVRVERVQSISDADARAEGLALAGLILPGRAPAVYAKLWDEINGDRAPWESNPWVWVVEFRKLETA